MIRNLFIAALLVLACCALAQGSLIATSYTGAGVSAQLQNQMLSALINAYNKFKNDNYQGQAQSISDELEEKTNYKFTVILACQVPQDSWFTLKTYDEVYAVWAGVNKMQITWTYTILATGLKSEDKSKNGFFYWWGSNDNAGKGISASQRKSIENNIQSLELKSCSSAGKELGLILSQKDSQAWNSICKKIDGAANGLLLVSTNQQYYVGRGKKCICFMFV